MPEEDTAQSSGLLHAFLAVNDAPCPVCSYNLRGVVLENCPECDSPIALSVGQGKIRQGVWLSVCLAFAMGLGFDLVVGLIFVVSVIMTGAEDIGSIYMLLSLSVLGALCAIAIYMLVRHQQAWLRLDRGNQIRWTIVIFVGVFLVHAMVPVGLFLLTF